MAACTPRYQIVCPPDNPDRLQYTPDRPWPRGTRRKFRVDFVADNATIVFDEDGKPSDLLVHMSLEARQKLQSRRLTPKSHVHASDE